MTRHLHAFDRFQRSHSRLAFPVAVAKKFADDEAGSLAALIAYYGFLSLFPLLLLLVTVLGFLLHGDPALERRVLDSALSQFPIIGRQLKLHALHGNGVALAIGLAGSTWAGLGVTQATQRAFNRVWAIPHKARPNFLAARLRGIALLLLLAVLSVASTVLAGAVTSSKPDTALRVAGIVVSLLVNTALFALAFRLLTARSVTMRQLWPGVLIAAVFWDALQAVGTYYVGHVVRHASATYGLFALVIGAVSWLSLGAQGTLVAAEINVVRARRLWPRSLFAERVPADEKALRALAKAEERSESQRIEVTFDRRES